MENTRVTVTDMEMTLETLIDKTNLSLILETIAGICYEKADHIQTSWQDGGLALQWEEAGDRINSLAERLDI